jgi:hypothetical protein
LREEALLSVSADVAQSGPPLQAYPYAATAGVIQPPLAEPYVTADVSPASLQGAIAVPMASQVPMAQAVAESPVPMAQPAVQSQADAQWAAAGAIPMVVPMAPQVPMAQPAVQSRADAQWAAKLEKVKKELNLEGTLADVARQATEALGIEVEGGATLRTTIEVVYESLFGTGQAHSQA